MYSNFYELIISNFGLNAGIIIAIQYAIPLISKHKENTNLQCRFRGGLWSGVTGGGGCNRRGLDLDEYTSLVITRVLDAVRSLEVGRDVWERRNRYFGGAVGVCAFNDSLQNSSLQFVLNWHCKVAGLYR